MISNWRTSIDPLHLTVKTDNNGVAVVRDLLPRAGQNFGVSHPGYLMPALVMNGKKVASRRYAEAILAPGMTAHVSVTMERKPNAKP